jgi:hypothetical protein
MSDQSGHDADDEPSSVDSGGDKHSENETTLYP